MVPILTGFTLVYVCCDSCLKDLPGFQFEARPKECLPAEFPQDQEGTCYFLNRYVHPSLPESCPVEEHVAAGMAEVTALSNQAAESCPVEEHVAWRRSRQPVTRLPSEESRDVIVIDLQELVLCFHVGLMERKRAYCLRELIKLNNNFGKTFVLKVCYSFSQKKIFPDRK